MAEAQHKLGDVDLVDAARYRHWKDHVLRFADLDPAGHVNNVAYAEIFEAGRVAFGIDAGSRALAPGTTTMIVRMTIDYLAQLVDFPGAVRVGTRVLSFGRSLRHRRRLARARAGHDDDDRAHDDRLPGAAPLPGRDPRRHPGASFGRSSCLLRSACWSISRPTARRRCPTPCATPIGPCRTAEPPGHA